MRPENPFEYGEAHLIPSDRIAQYYIDDHNHGRLLRSRRNIFLIGERGSGKTMALLYNTLGVQRVVAAGEDSDFDLSRIGVLVPANTPLTHRREFELLDRFPASVVSEHFLALSIVYHLADALRPLHNLVSADESASLRAEMNMYLDAPLPTHTDVFDAICQMAQRESIEAQKQLNDPHKEWLYPTSLSFVTIVIPLMRAIKKASAFRGSHFMLMLDDFHNLNEHQVLAVNSWMAYRDRTLFSLKVASARVDRPPLTTTTGGAILEGHDFVTIDLEHPLHSGTSEFGKFAAKVVGRRLERFGVKRSPEEFFPVHERLLKELGEAAERARARAETLFGNNESKKIADYVFKQRWAEYMRQRSPKANLPQYSGFATIVFLSTGVIRNLLEPCWWMWDAAVSALPDDERGSKAIEMISPGIQARKIKERSDAAWRRLDELASSIDGCARDEEGRIRRMFEELAAFFVERLMKHASEPGATSFSISGQEEDVMTELRPLLEIAQKAQLLYVRSGSAKARGRREKYYVPNRMLWPTRGLDPRGQYGRAWIQAEHLLNATSGVSIPLGSRRDVGQGRLFTGEEE